MRTIEEIKKDLMYLPNAFGSNESVEDFKINLDELIETVAQLQREKCAEECLMIRKEIGNDTYIQKTKNKIEIDEEAGFFNMIEIDKESILNAKIWT